jgi:2-polyprenyl-3-methyl-5-hydroxy-6-metoxy-1,4-benzoquinol methylase
MDLLKRLFTREFNKSYQETLLDGNSEAPEIITLDFPACIEREFPQAFSPAWVAVEQVLAAIKEAKFSPLERHSPGLKGFDWEIYLRCSVVRMVRVLSALSQRGVTAGNLLDCGAYFGNFSLMCASEGYQVDALDSYKGYEQALSGVTNLLYNSGIKVIDFDEVGYDLHQIHSQTYDIVLCMGVIEHIPHTPRLLLESLNRVLKPGGLLVIDTPNLAYLYNRQKLARGESIFCPISLQYFTELPFEGHHREYTLAEVKWMLEQIGHTNIYTETFNYSVYGLSILQGHDLDNYKIMMAEPESREIIMTVSRKSFLN